MASFRDKIKVTKKSTGERVFFPKTLGIYTIDNPKVDKRQYQPEIVGLPLAHRTSTVDYKGDSFQRVTYWLGRLYAEPIVINMGTFPVDALYTGTDIPIFPNVSNNFDKRIPMVGDEFGVTIPETYDTLVSVESERKKLHARLMAEKVSDKLRAFVDKKLAELSSKADTDTIRVTHDVKMTPRIYIPAIVADVQELEDLETGDIEKQYVPTLAIFEQNLTISFGESLQKSKKIDDKYDMMEVADYLYSETDNCIGDPILIFRHPLTTDSKTGNQAFCVSAYNEKPSKQTAPLLDIRFDREISHKEFLRVIILDMIGLFASKDDKESIEYLLRQAIYNSVKSNDNNIE